MRTIPTSRFAHIEEFLGIGPNSGACPLFYRGIGSQHKLLPTIAYEWVKIPPEHFDELSDLALQKFETFFKQQKPHIDFSDYRLKFIARHFGLISPYLDFTKDITIAIQFGMEKADSNSVHIYCLDSTGVPIYDEHSGMPIENIGIAIFRPNLIWREPGMEIGERTQNIQLAKLVTQHAINVSKPFSENNPYIPIRFEIAPEHFQQLKEDIENTGTRMDTDLLIDKGNCIFEEVKRINNESISEIKAKYKLS